MTNNLVEVNVNEVATDYIVVECPKCCVEHTIVSDAYGLEVMLSDIDEGANPFVDGWEDNVGNTITCECVEDETPKKSVISQWREVIERM